MLILTDMDVPERIGVTAVYAVTPATAVINTSFHTLHVLLYDDCKQKQSDSNQSF